MSVPFDKRMMRKTPGGALTVAAGKRVWLLERGDPDRTIPVDGNGDPDLSGETEAIATTTEFGVTLVDWPAYSNSEGLFPDVWPRQGRYDIYCPDDSDSPLTPWNALPVSRRLDVSRTGTTFSSGALTAPNAIDIANLATVDFTYQEGFDVRLELWIYTWNVNVNSARVESLIEDVAGLLGTSGVVGRARRTFDGTNTTVKASPLARADLDGSNFTPGADYSFKGRVRVDSGSAVTIGAFALAEDDSPIVLSAEFV